jgi:hypothetical protein
MMLSLNRREGKKFRVVRRISRDLGERDLGSSGVRPSKERKDGRKEGMVEDARESDRVGAPGGKRRGLRPRLSVVAGGSSYQVSRSRSVIGTWRGRECSTRIP